MNRLEQGRESGRKHCLRAYAPDSPEARARLLVVALLADGRLDGRELGSLRRRGAYEQIGISPGGFQEVFHHFCADVARMPLDPGLDLVASAPVAGLLEEISDSAGRRTLLGLIFQVIRSDGHLDAAEARLFWQAIDAWHLRIEDASGQGRHPDGAPGL